MKSIATGATILALSAGTALGGGIDRARLSYGALFEAGSYAEFGFSNVSPSVSGDYANPAFGTTTGDMAGSYRNYSFTYKRDFGDKVSFGLFVNTPYGADANYSVPGLYNGLSAQWSSQQIAAVLRYEVTPAISVYGGLKYERSKAEINIPDSLIRGGLQQAALGGSAQASAILGGSPAGSLQYTAEGDWDGRFGFIVGAAYEKPEIALRVGLTYESGYTHKFDSVETIGSPALGPTFAALGNGTTEVEMPQSITLDFQTGVAKDTLVFGSIRWAEWSVWQVRPPAYGAVFGSDITNFENDVFTYQLGVGRRLNENFSVFARASYEKSNGGIASRLSPTDGSRSFGIGGTYTKDAVKVTAGIEYVKVGDAVDGSGTRFAGNDAVGFGVSVGYRF